jgi:hypothetical protein
MDRPESPRRHSSSGSPFEREDRRRASRPGGAPDEEALSPLSASSPGNQRAADVLAEIGAEFNRLREGSRTTAFGALQKKLWAHVDVLVPSTVTLKDFIGLSIDIESFIKSDTGTTTEEPLEVFRKFLDEDAPLSTGSRPRKAN